MTSSKDALPFTQDYDIAGQLLGQLRALEGAKLQVRFEMVGTGRAAKDAMPGVETTYGTRLAELDGQLDRLKSEFADVLPLAEEIHARQVAETERSLAAQREADAQREAAPPS